jgi:hypothetical protein
MVWRRMRSAGSLSLDNGLWILPFNGAGEKFIQEMKVYIESQGGSCKMFVANTLDRATEAEILDRFRLDRAEEYAELKEQCLDFLAEIEKETRRQNFSFAEYEENEQDLDKLKTWLGKIMQRDFEGGRQQEEAAGWLDQCRQALNGFAAQVFDNEKN